MEYSFNLFYSDMHLIPQEFKNRMVEVYGDQGRKWVDQLPSTIDEFSQRWSLTLGTPFSLSYNFVAPVTREDGSEAVLKLGVPNRELLSEIHALKLYKGKAIVQLLEVDLDQQVFLIERIKPGEPLENLEDDDRRTRIAAQVMEKLWVPVNGEYPILSVESWTAGLMNLRPHFDDTTGPFPDYLVNEAEAIFADFIPSQGERVLLHGDLHHWNILSATRLPWLALDPKGVLGEREYDVGALLRNPNLEHLTKEDLKKLQDRRVAILVEMLNFNRKRIIGWGLAQAVLSAWWSMEDHGVYWEPTIKCADVFFELWKKA